jgi:hypothetical protein
MKKLLLFGLPALIATGIIFTCSDVFVEDSNPDKNGGQTNDPSGGMSNGDDSSLTSRAVWEQMRLMDPATGEIPPGIRERELLYAMGLPKNMNKSFTWNLRGPVNKGGRTRALGIDVLDEDHILAGGVTAGIWESNDGGLTWEKVTQPLQMHSITHITQDIRPGHENTWYAGTGEHYGIVSASTFEAQYSGNGILKSTDNGATWQELTATQSNTPQTYLANHQMDFVWRVVVDPSDMTNDVVLAAVYNGVCRSDDGGATWTEVLGFLQGGFSSLHSDYVDLVVTPGGIFYASISSDSPSKGMFRSDDGGITWTDITPATFPTSYGRMVMAVNPLNEDEVFYFGSTNGAYANGHSFLKYTYLSGDGSGAGGTWEDRSMNLPYQSCFISEINFEAGYLNTQGSYDIHMAVHPMNDSVIFIAGTSIWRNKDQFTSDTTNTWIGGYQCDPLPYDDLNWTLSYPNHHPDQHVLMFMPSDPNVLINGNDGGVYKTVNNLADSIDWVPMNNGYVSTQFYSVAIEPGNTTSEIVIGGMQDNGTWFTEDADFDSLWMEVGGGDGMYCAITENAEFYIICTQNGKMFLKEVDAQGNVLAHERIDPEDGPASYNWCNSLKLDPNNTNTLYWNGRTKLMRLDDLHNIAITGDKTNKEPDFWVTIDEAGVNPGGGIITDIEMCQAGLNKVWYGSSQGDVYRLDDANSPTPVKVDITSPDFPTGGYVSCIAVNPFDADEIMVTFANYNNPSIFYTKDGGTTWEDIGGNLEENLDGTGNGPAVLWAEVYPDGTLFAGTTVGLFTTTNPDTNNTIWTLEAGIGNVVINHMDFRTYDGRFVVATHGNGIYSTNLAPAFASTSTNQPLSDLRVYPTVADQFINISSEKAGTVYIYNLQGQLMHEVALIDAVSQVDVSGYSSGMYLVAALVNGKKVVRKFVKN